MAKREAVTDYWVHDLLIQANINLDAQGSTIKELDDTLKTASKRGTGKVGFPEFCGIVKDFVIVIEDKPTITKHIAEVEGVITNDTQSIINYAVNGALFYGRHLAKLTSYKKFICLGVSGNEKHHRVTPLYVDERGNYVVLPDVEII